MDRFKFFFTVALIAGAVVWAKSIKISVNGAEAVAVQDESEPEDVFTTDEAEEGDEFRNNEKLQPQSTDDRNFSEVLSHEQTMVRLLKSQKLCEFDSYVKKHGVSKAGQYKALGKSLGEPFRELDVFAGVHFYEIKNFKTEVAKAYLVGKKLGAFVVSDFKINEDMDKGLTEEHKELLQQIEELQSMNPSNLLYSLFRNDIYMHYKNLNEDKKSSLMKETMATSQYVNPIYDMMRALYNLTKNNVAQFYVAYDLLEKNTSIDSRLIEYSVWRLYDESMREHINGILQKYVDNITDSSKSFGYEGGVYKGYRHVLPFEMYEATQDLTQFEESLPQPTYLLRELKLNLSEKCDDNQVNNLAIMLRAL